MELEEWETVRRHTVNYTLHLRINFLKDSQKVFRFQTMKLRRFNQNFKFRFLVTVFPDGVNKETEGWLVVLRDVRIPKREPRPKDYGILSNTVSVIDIEGNSRLPRSFVEIPSEEDDKYPKYLERSVILSRKDEFLSQGVLTVRCDIHFYISTVFSEGFIHRILKDFLCSIPQEFCYKEETPTKDPRDFSKKDLRDALTVFDFTHQILTLSPSHESRRRFVVYGVPSTVPSPSSCSEEEEGTDVLEHVWIFDTETARFLVSLDERQNGVGVGPRLLKASPVIRRMVDAPMKERHEKRIYFPDITSRTFLIVLYFLLKGTLPTSPNRDFLGVYKFSHLYEMEVLQRKCAEEMARSVEFSTEELKKTAEDYSDEYFSELLVSRWRDFEDSEQPTIRKFDRLDSDSYI